MDDRKEMFGQKIIRIENGFLFDNAVTWETDDLFGYGSNVSCKTFIPIPKLVPIDSIEPVFVPKYLRWHFLENITE